MTALHRGRAWWDAGDVDPYEWALELVALEGGTLLAARYGGTLMALQPFVDDPAELAGRVGALLREAEGRALCEGRPMQDVLWELIAAARAAAPAAPRPAPGSGLRRLTDVLWERWVRTWRGVR